MTHSGFLREREYQFTPGIGSRWEQMERDREEEGKMKEVDVGNRGHVGRHGWSFGSALAIAISWSAHKSILWAILHGIFSWFFVAYYAIWGRP